MEPDVPTEEHPPTVVHAEEHLVTTVQERVCGRCLDHAIVAGIGRISPFGRESRRDQQEEREGQEEGSDGRDTTPPSEDGIHCIRQFSVLLDEHALHTMDRTSQAKFGLFFKPSGDITDKIGFPAFSKGAKTPQFQVET